MAAIASKEHLTTKWNRTSLPQHISSIIAMDIYNEVIWWMIWAKDLCQKKKLWDSRDISLNFGRVGIHGSSHNIMHSPSPISHYKPSKRLSLPKMLRIAFCISNIRPHEVDNFNTLNHKAWRLNIIILHACLANNSMLKARRSLKLNSPSLVAFLNLSHCIRYFICFVWLTPLK